MNCRNFEDFSSSGGRLRIFNPAGYLNWIASRCFYGLYLLRLFRQADGKNFNKNELDMKTVKGFTEVSKRGRLRLGIPLQPTGTEYGVIQIFVFCGWIVVSVFFN